MGFVEKRSGEQGYRARYRDPLGRQHSRTFVRKADAQRFLVEMEADKARGSWIDPRGADTPLAAWVEEFLKLARRLSPTTVQTYRRDLDRYVLPRFCGYRIGRLPADEIENWLNDEVAAGIAPSSVHRHYRTLRRVLQVAVQKQRLLANPCDRVEPPRVPKREMTFLSWEQVVGGQPAEMSLVRPLIKAPGAYNLVATLAARAGMDIRLSPAGRRARNAVSLWSSQLWRSPGCSRAPTSAARCWPSPGRWRWGSASRRATWPWPR
ncbi:MAG: site-specific integrase [Actinomycetota bacterium]|nr:site-specific integrase [Actinomycetota bacterium]